MNNTKKNVYQMVTDRIVEQMSKGVIPWRQPWVGGSAMAISYTTRKAYSALNQLLLGKPGEWLTWNQIRVLGGHVRKGAKSGFCVFFKPIEEYTETPEQDEDNGTVSDQRDARRRFVLKWYHVFHIDDTEGIPSKLTTVRPSSVLSPIENAEKAIRSYLGREATLKFINDRESSSAYYSPALDEVVVPMLQQYAIPEEYYSTAFHEFTHSTMKETRCDRRSESGITRFGDSDYSREELVAEIGSAMLCNRLGIECDKAFRNSAAYIQSWLKALKNDNRMIVWASAKAEQAARYILGDTLQEAAGD